MKNFIGHFKDDRWYRERYTRVHGAFVATKQTALR
jgi:hypothetical protein